MRVPNSVEVFMLAIFSYYWKEIIVIFLITSAASMYSSKIGIFVSSLCTLGYATLSIAFASGGVSGGDNFLIFGIFVFPAISWIGFFLGKFLRNTKRYDI